MNDPQGARGDAARVGSWVGVAAAVAMGGVLMACVLGATGLVISLGVGTAVVACFAWFAGARAGGRIAGLGPGPAVGIGALGGLACLAVASVTAGLIGAVWGLTDRSGLSAHNVWSYLGKPMFAVLAYGIWFALPLGALAGGVIFLILKMRHRAAQ